MLKLEEHGFSMRNAKPSDHKRVMNIMLEWWGGRDLRHGLPRLWFDHFNDTSFIIEDDNEVVSFLVGFMSQSQADTGYIHFVGVHPDHRQKGLGEFMYQQFFELCLWKKRTIVCAITSPVNTSSIAFHARMGFDVEDQDEKKFFTKVLNLS